LALEPEDVVEESEVFVFSVPESESESEAGVGGSFENFVLLLRLNDRLTFAFLNFLIVNFGLRTVKFI